MRIYRVDITSQVREQMLDQFAYIAGDSPATAMEWYDRLERAVMALGEYPGLAVDEDATIRMKRETRKLVFERTYLVFFQVNEKAAVIEVVGFRHGMRLPKPGEP